MNTCNVVCSSVHQEMVFGGPFLLYSIGIVADHAEWMSKFSPDNSSAGKFEDAILAIGSSIMLFKGETTITHVFSGEY